MHGGASGRSARAPTAHERADARRVTGWVRGRRRGMRKAVCDGQLSPSSAAAPAQARGVTRRARGGRAGGGVARRRRRRARPVAGAPGAGGRAGGGKPPRSPLAARSRVGAESEAEVRRVLERLDRDGWQVRHARRLAGRGDLDHVVRAPSGIGFVIETKTLRWTRAHLERTSEAARWLARRRRRYPRGVVPVLCVTRARQVQHVAGGVLVVRWTGSCRRCAPAPWAVASNAASVLLCAECGRRRAGSGALCARHATARALLLPSIRCDGGPGGRADRLAGDTAHAPIAGLRATSGARRRAGRRASCARAAARC